MKTDVLIVGGGLSGLIAADTIVSSSGLSVTLLQCGNGASPYIHAFCMPVGPGDSEDCFLADTLAAGYGHNAPRLAMRLCGGWKDALEYIHSLDLEIDYYRDGSRLLRALGSSRPRITGVCNNTGPSMIRKIRERLAASGQYREYRGLRALECVKTGDRVTGVRCFEEAAGRFVTLSAGVVILASGGFGRLFPDTTNSPDIGGDGAAMAYRAGAALTDMEFVQFEPCVGIWPPRVAGKGIVTTMFYDGAVLRAADGRRFMQEEYPEGERVSKDRQSRSIWAEIQRHGATEHGGVWFDASGVPAEKMKGVYQAYWNRYLACGIDLQTEAVEVAPASHTTCGGVLVDENCGTGIPGLLVCGEAAGGIHGANRMGGNAGLETMVFGRIAGFSAIAQYRSPEELSEQIEPDGKAGENVQRGYHRMRRILRRDLNVIRDSIGLEQACRELSDIYQENQDPSGYEQYRLYNDVTAALALALSAAARKGSVGCHFRWDPQTETTRYRTVVRQKEGIMTVQQESV